MFGYVRCYKDELKVKDVKKYSAYYCGVCSRIQHKWGNLFRISLSYDATFISIFLDGFSINSEEYQCGCPLAPLKKKKKLDCNVKVLDYAALINGYLFIKKLEDNYQDDKNWFCGILAVVCKKLKGYRCLQEEYSELFVQLEQYYSLYMEAERNRSADSFDEYSGMFGDVLGIIWKGILIVDTEHLYGDREEKALFAFGKILGMWIYTIDALDDYYLDRKKGHFNPLTFLKLNESSVLEQVEKILRLMQMDLLMCYKQIGSNRNQDIVQNILTYGMGTTMCRIIKKQRKEK